MIGIRAVSSLSSGIPGKDTVGSLLASLMEVVRTTVACECVYVRAMVLKALVWMQSPYETFDELESIIASELSDPSWPATLLNDILLTLHARFKVKKLKLSTLTFLFPFYGCENLYLSCPIFLGAVSLC